MSTKEKKERTTNFKTYEAQARLLAALVASLPKNQRFDYKSIAGYIGGTTTESAVEHRFRAVKAQGEILRGLVERGEDPSLYKVYACKTTKDDIQRLFGASTPEGVGFQFRGIRKAADALGQAAANGESPVEAFASYLKGGSGAADSVPVTPSQSKAGSAKRPRPTRATGSRSGATTANKRRKAAKVKVEPDFDDDEDSPEENYSELDSTPTKLQPKVLTTPRKNPGQLVPRSAWAKPVEKPAPRHVRIAPRAPGPEAYKLAPIPGIGSYAAPNGYTNPATGLGYNCAGAPPPAMGSANPSAANSPTMEMATMRRGSTFSTGSYTAASSPATPIMSYPEPAANNMSQYYHVPGAAVGMAVHPDMYSAGTGTNMAASNPAYIGSTTTSAAVPTTRRKNNTPSFNMNPFDPAISPVTSASGVHTPQTTTSSLTMSSGMRATDIATSFQTDDEFNHFSGFSTAHNVGNGNGYQPGTNTAANDAGSHDASYAAHASFGGFVGDEEWEAGDC